MTTKNLIPRASGEGGIGITDVTWGYGYYDTGNFNKGLFVSGHNITQVIAETVTQGGLGGEWTRNGLDIYYNGGNVGIGIAAPGARLSVEIGSTTIPSAKFNNLAGDAGSTVHIVESETSSDHFGLFVGDNDTNGAKLTAVLLTKYRNVGIGAINPAGKLHVSDLSESIGNVDVIQGSNQITGTDLNTKLSNGDKIRINTSTFTVSSVTATTLTLSSNWPNATINGVEAFKNKELFIVKNNGNVGIGTTSPTTELDVIGRIKSDSITGNNGLGIASGGTGNLNLFHGSFGTTAELGITIASGGNVGIGTTNPEVPLMIKANSSADSMIKLLDEAAYVEGETRSGISFQGNDTGGARTSFGGIEAYGASGQRGGLRFVCRPAPSSTVVGMVLNEDSNVGIGTTNPGTKLDVRGSLNANTPTATFYNGWGSAKATLLIVDDFTSMNHVGLFVGKEDLSSAVLITKYNNVGIGTTSPEANLHIQGVNDEAYGPAIRLQKTGATLFTYNTSDTVGSFSQLVLGNRDSTGSMSRIVSVLTQLGTSELSFSLTASSVQSERMRIGTSGVKVNNLSVSSDVQTNASGYLATSSDKRLKNDLGDCEYGLNEVLQVQPKRYTWKDGPKDANPTVGFFAQDVHDVMPEAAPREAIQNEKGEDDYKWGFHSQTIIAALVNATKEQQQLIEDLKSRIETLENK